MLHIDSKLIPLVKKSNKKRINYILKDNWIEYTKVLVILDKLEDLLVYPNHWRMPNYLIVSDNQNGKRTLLSRFYSNNRPYIRDNDNIYIAPIICIKVSSKLSEKYFYNSILNSFGCPYEIDDELEMSLKRVFFILRRSETKIIIIDEIHNISIANLNALENIANELQLVIVGVGNRNALFITNINKPFTNRFEPVFLPKWQMNNEYLKLLTSFECLLPLKYPSNLSDRILAEQILKISDGTIGQISNVIKKAAILAIQKEVEFINKEILDSIVLSINK